MLFFKGPFVQWVYANFMWSAVDQVLKIINKFSSVIQKWLKRRYNFLKAEWWLNKYHYKKCGFFLLGQPLKPEQPFGHILGTLDSCLVITFCNTRVSVLFPFFIFHRDNEEAPSGVEFTSKCFFDADWNLLLFLKPENNFAWTRRVGLLINVIFMRLLHVYSLVNAPWWTINVKYISFNKSSQKNCSKSSHVNTLFTCWSALVFWSSNLNAWTPLLKSSSTNLSSIRIQWKNKLCV